MSDALVPLSQVESWIVAKERCEWTEGDSDEEERREEKRREEEAEVEGRREREHGVRWRDTLNDRSDMTDTEQTTA